MLCVRPNGTEINTCDFIQDHSVAFTETERWMARYTIQLNIFYYFMQGEHPSVRIENLSYLRRILDEIREEKID